MNQEILLQQIKNQNTLNKDLLTTTKSLKSKLISTMTDLKEAQKTIQKLQSQIRIAKKKQNVLKKQMTASRKKNKIALKKIINDFEDVKDMVVRNNYEGMYYKLVNVEKQNLVLKNIIVELGSVYGFDVDVFVELSDFNELEDVVKEMLKEI